MEQKKVIKVSDVKNLVEGGMTKKEVGEHFGLNTRELNVLFQHKSLKGIVSRRKPVSFVIEDDTNESDTELIKDGYMFDNSEVIEENTTVSKETY